MHHDCTQALGITSVFGSSIRRARALRRFCVLVLRAGRGPTRRVVGLLEVLALVPLGCFVKGRDAKLLPDPSGWVFWHTLWHCSGGLVVTLGVWMLYRAPAEAAASGLHIG